MTHNTEKEKGGLTILSFVLCNEKWVNKNYISNELITILNK